MIQLLENPFLDEETDFANLSTSVEPVSHKLNSNFKPGPSTYYYDMGFGFERKKEPSWPWVLFVVLLSLIGYYWLINQFQQD